MLKLFLDTDVCFDILSKREPHFDASYQVFRTKIIERNSIFISEHSVATLIYLSFESQKIKHADLKLINFIQACECVNVGKKGLLEAIRQPLHDKEDAIQYVAARNAGVDFFITRNIKDYQAVSIEFPILTPLQFFESNV